MTSMEHTRLVNTNHPLLGRQDVRALGRIVAAMLRERYPLHSAKQIARVIGCAPKTADNLLDGHLSVATLSLLIAAFGPGFVAEAVMAAAGTNMIDFIKNQAAAARAEALRHQETARELAQIEADLRAARQAVDQGRVGLAP